MRFRPTREETTLAKKGFAKIGTKTCERCKGTGCEKGAAVDAFKSREPVPYIAKCRDCGGKGVTPILKKLEPRT